MTERQSRKEITSCTTGSCGVEESVAGVVISEAVVDAPSKEERMEETAEGCSYVAEHREATASPATAKGNRSSPLAEKARRGPWESNGSDRDSRVEGRVIRTLMVDSSIRHAVVSVAAAPVEWLSHCSPARHRSPFTPFFAPGRSGRQVPKL